jgi:arsenite methyltransferase
MTDPVQNYKWRWSHVDDANNQDKYVDLLAQVRPSDDPSDYPNTIPWVDARSGERILEVGCGTGAVARAVARHTPGILELVAVDNSERMVREAQRPSQGRSLHNVSFVVADAHELPFADASFDRCYAMEVFAILPDPRRAFEELVRVTRPGGTLCLWESDCDTRAVASNDPALARRVMRYIGDHEFNGDVARQLVAWLKELRWEITVLIPTVGLMQGPSLLQSALYPEFLEDAVHAGAVRQEEADTFLAEVRFREENGDFFGYLVNFRLRAVKPS